jgi:hypothetical protein
MPKHLYTLPSGSALPATSGLPNGSPFLLVNGDGSVAFKVLHAGGWRDALTPEAPGPPAPTAPDAPTGVAAVAAAAAADVSWTAPASDGGSAITGYTIIPDDGSPLAGVAAASSPHTVTGLTDGTAYTFTVIATNAVGDSVPSGASAPATPTAPPPFSDNFNRTNRNLNGDNGWVNSTGTGMGAVPVYAITSNVVNQATANGDTDPILHLRGGSSAVADVSIDAGWVASSGFKRGFLYVCSDLGNANSIGMWWDGGATDILVQRHVGADSNAGQWFATTQTVVSAWAGWTFPTMMTIRAVYTQSTKLLQIYQNGTLRITCDMSASNFGGGAELPALSSMPYCGFSGRSGDQFDNVVCA